MIRPERPDDQAAIREVNRRAFGKNDEAELVDALRAGGYHRVSLVAEVAGRVVGHILFSVLSVNSPTSAVEVLGLAPMAVLPEHQRSGIGSALVTEGLRLCREAGHAAVLVVGHPAYYPRFGFSPELARRLRTPYAGASFMALDLVPGALDDVEGEVVYPPPFDLV